jgi:hypothetical protein
MPLPAPTVARSPVHTRRLQFEAYKRADGLWDIEAHLTDAKPADFALVSGVRSAGEPIHDMRIRLTITRDLDIVDALALTEAMPYAPECAQVTPDYRKLIGLNLRHAFRKAVQQRFHDTAGCRHINEALWQFPTAAIQAMAGEHVDEDGVKPFHLDHCRARDTRGEAVRKYYPRWYRGAKTGTE